MARTFVLAGDARISIGSNATGACRRCHEGDHEHCVDLDPEAVVPATWRCRCGCSSIDGIWPDA